MSGKPHATLEPGLRGARKDTRAVSIVCAGLEERQWAPHNQPPHAQQRRLPEHTAPLAYRRSQARTRNSHRPGYVPRSLPSLAERLSRPKTPPPTVGVRQQPALACHVIERALAPTGAADPGGRRLRGQTPQEIVMVRVVSCIEEDFATWFGVHSVAWLELQHPDAADAHRQHAPAAAGRRSIAGTPARRTNTIAGPRWGTIVVTQPPPRSAAGARAVQPEGPHQSVTGSAAAPASDAAPGRCSAP